MRGMKNRQNKMPQLKFKGTSRILKGKSIVNKNSKKRGKTG